MIEQCLFPYFTSMQQPPLPAIDSSSVEIQKYFVILQSRLQRGPLLMDPEFADAERKRKQWAASRQQTLYTSSSELTVGAA